ncbi:MAG: hypothetical protein HZB29_00210 [Nitrospinae bacterium]|nr:hypothetical protein [Nitrospinota bacterium]
MTEQDVTPKKEVYLIIILVMFMGALVAAVIVVRGFWNVQDTTRREFVPGSLTMKIDEPGRYYVYHEHKSIIKGESIIAKPGFPAGFSFSVKDPAGNSVIVYPNKLLKYFMGGMEGVSHGYFDAAAAGVYMVNVSSSTPVNPGERFVMSAGGNVPALTNKAFINGVDTFLATMALSILLWTAIFAARRIAKKKIYAKIESAKVQANLKELARQNAPTSPESEAAALYMKTKKKKKKK